ncbi:polysaccharide deacetylase family protein [Siccirubricoccus deserti]
MGGYLNICLHPFVSGRALRIAMLDRLFSRMKTLPGCGSRAARRWRATASPPAHPRPERSGTMPWKDGYTISDERSLADAEVAWPGGARCCVTLTVDLSPPCGPAGIQAADLRTPDAQYGMHGGLDALLGVLRKHRLRATFAVPAVIAGIHADRVQALAAEGHEIAAHGYRHEDVSGLDRAEERARLDRTTAMIAAATGYRPMGWYSLARPGDNRRRQHQPAHHGAADRGRLRLYGQWPGR